MSNGTLKSLYPHFLFRKKQWERREWFYYRLCLVRHIHMYLRSVKIRIFLELASKVVEINKIFLSNWINKYLCIWMGNFEPLKKAVILLLATSKNFYKCMIMLFPCVLGQIIYFNYCYLSIVKWTLLTLP